MTGTQIKIALAGGIVGFLETIGILFEPNERYGGFIIAAGVLNGALVSMLIASLLSPGCTVLKALLVGGIIGFLMGTVTFLAKGGWVSWDAPFVVPAGVVSGVIIGALVRWIGRGESSADSKD